MRCFELGKVNIVPETGQEPIIESWRIIRQTRQSALAPCFEEDFDWCIVALTFPNLFPSELRAEARAMLKRYRPEPFKAFTEWKRTVSRTGSSTRRSMTLRQYEKESRHETWDIRLLERIQLNIHACKHEFGEIMATSTKIIMCDLRNMGKLRKPAGLDYTEKPVLIGVSVRGGCAWSGAPFC